MNISVHASVRAALASALAFALTACGGGQQNGVAGPGVIPGGGATAPATAASSSPIKHVVLIVQENRSFDNLFAHFPNADGARTGKLHTGATVVLKAADLAEGDINHGYTAWVAGWAKGKMNGFDLEGYGDGQTGSYPYQYIKPAQIAPYWTLAKQYVLADHMFATEKGGSFTAHQDLIAGTTALNDEESLVDVPSQQPWGCDAAHSAKTSLLTKAGAYEADKGPWPCLTQYPTLRDVLDRKHVSWKYYAPSLASGDSGYLWNAFDAIAAVREGPEWKTNVATSSSEIFTDIKANRLPAVSWVIPDELNSDHPGHTDTGPSWVASIVNAVGKSADWNSTAIVIVWDDWGGFYDHVPPPQLDYAGLGFRVPCILVGPYALHGVVSHTQYEFGSILKFIEQNWGLSSLNATDARATSIVNAFDFTQKPRKFTPIASDVPQAFFEHQRPSGLPVDTQ
jgi:phospholipase C